MSALAAAQRDASVRTRSGPARASVSQRRRARSAFHAAARLVEALLNMPALPGPGEERLRGRAVACHIAREAFNVPMFLLADAAGLDRRSVDASARRVWERRDDNPGLEREVEILIATLKTMQTDQKLLRQAWAARQVRAAMKPRLR